MPRHSPAPRPASSLATAPAAADARLPTERARAPLGTLLRAWRARRQLSQLALALEAGVSQRHLSFVELGRTRASRELVRRLAGPLGLSLRERNTALLAAGYAPEVPERPLDDPALAPARAAIEHLLTAHDPYPALAVDRRWNLLASNRAFEQVILDGASAALRRPPVNVLRLTLHPDGLARRIVNLREWRAALLSYLTQQVAASGDGELDALLKELRGYPDSPLDVTDAMQSSGAASTSDRHEGVFVPLLLASDRGTLSFLSTVTVFAAPSDVTLAELVIESFFPADAVTASRLREAAASRTEHRIADT